MGSMASAAQLDAFLDTFRVEEITGTEAVTSAYELRYRVWSMETRLIDTFHRAGAICDEHDTHARHWAAFDGYKLVAAARMCIHDTQEESPDAPAFSMIRVPTPVATINRLVVLSSVCNRGLAKKLDEHRIAAATADGAKCILGTAAPRRIAALEKLGFHLTGDSWIPPYCESQAMKGMVLVL